MALFDSEDQFKTADLHAGVEKSRLFDTLKDEGRSVHDYLKLFLIVVLSVIVIGGLVVYFTMPGFGDEVRPPAGLEEAVKTHFNDQEKRAVSEAAYFYCNDFYWARVNLEKRPDITARKLDEGHRRVTATQNESGAWQIAAAVANGTEDPCTR